MKTMRLVCILGFLLIGTTASAADGDMIVNGKLGIGTTSPASKLDVNGDVRVGNGNASCSSAIEGAVRYNATYKIMEFCNGSNWQPFMPGAYEKLLLHFDGTSGSTTFTDSSYIPHTAIVHGTAQISTTSPKFGTGSLYLDGSGYVTIPNSDDFNFGSGDFTIDFWIKRLDQGMWQVPLATHDSRGYSGFEFTFTPSYQLRFENWNSQTNDFHVETSGIIWNTGQWYHLALVRSANTITIYMDGTSVASCSFSGTVGPSSNELKIGRRFDGSYNFVGYIDEIHITKGKALWTSNFTPPTAPY